MRMRRAPAGSAARQIDRHRPEESRREADVVGDAAPPAVGQLRFDPRHDGGDVGLVRGKDRGRREVIGEAVHQEADGCFPAAGLPRSSSSEWSGAKPLNDVGWPPPPNESAIPMAQRVHHVAPAAVPRAGRQPRAARGNRPIGRVWRHRREVLVRVDVGAVGVIDREELHLIEVDHFFHRLGEPERQPAVFLAHLPALDLHELVDVGDVARAGGDPVADDRRADGVGDELVALAVPGEEHRAGAAATIDLRDRVPRVRFQLHFVLDDAGRPQQAHDIGLRRLADAGKDLRRALCRVAGRRDGLELLPHRAGLHFDLRADAAPVVVQAEQRDADGVVGVAAVVAEDDRRLPGDRQQQVAVVVAIGISRRNRVWHAGRAGCRRRRPPTHPRTGRRRCAGPGARRRPAGRTRRRPGPPSRRCRSRSP